jgi:hypothetical protein
MSVMRPVTVSERFAGTVAEAERCWYEAPRWPRWVDGCERVVDIEPGWPEVGSGVIWESGPAGRGRVNELVIEREPLRGLTLEVSDASIRGRQTVAFVPDDGAVTVELSLDYRLERRSIVSPLVDLLFIRRAMTASLASTVHRFGFELQASRRGAGNT